MQNYAEGGATWQVGYCLESQATHSAINYQWEATII